MAKTLWEVLTISVIQKGNVLYNVVEHASPVERVSHRVSQLCFVGADPEPGDDLLQLALAERWEPLSCFDRTTVLTRIYSESDRGSLIRILYPTELQ